MPAEHGAREEDGAGDLTLKVLRAGAAEGSEPGTLQLFLETSRGEIHGLLHPVEGGTGAVVCVGGARGGLDGPADRLYARLPSLLREAAATVLRVHYRHPNALDECVLDVLAGCSFLRGIGAADIVLVGHSFGGAVVIRAGSLFPVVRGVVSLSPQLHGTAEVNTLGVPLLLIHGVGDTILSHEASEDIYRRAQDPREIVLFAETGHGLIEARDEMDAILEEWISARLDDRPATSGRRELVPGEGTELPGKRE
jgi:alpha-beta hydrolase superfamily lysophospholipase